MLILLIPTFGLGPVIISVIRLKRGMKNPGTIIWTIVSAMYLIFWVWIFTTDTDNSVYEVPEPDSSIEETAKPAKTKKAKAKKKDPLENNTGFDDEYIFNSFIEPDDDEDGVLDDVTEPLAYNIFMNHYADNEVNEVDVDILKGFLEKFPKSEHKKTIKTLLKKVKEIYSNLPSEETQDWLDENEKFCTEIDDYYVNTFASISFVDHEIWGHEFKIAYHANMNAEHDNTIVILTDNPLSYEGKQHLSMINTHETTVFKRSGYERDVPVYIVPDPESVQLYEEAMDAQLLSSDAEKKQKKLKKEIKAIAKKEAK